MDTKSNKQYSWPVLRDRQVIQFIQIASVRCNLGKAVKNQLVGFELMQFQQVTKARCKIKINFNENGVSKVVDFPTRMKELREECNLTQQELADKIGVKRGTIAAWEAGRMPERQAVERLADFFGATTDYLLGRSAKRYKQDNNSVPVDIEKIMRESRIMFDGDILDDEDKEDLIEFLKIAMKAIRKRRTQYDKANDN